jgi:aspartate kinase
MTRLVMKFGGTSVADLERIRRVGRLVAAEVAAG